MSEKRLSKISSEIERLNRKKRAHQVKCSLVFRSRMKLPVTPKEICGIIQATALEHAPKQTGEIIVKFVGPKEASFLNATFRKKRDIPDVLSFAYKEKGPVYGGMELGEIVVCLSAVRGHKSLCFRDELAHILAHATLHIIGIHHEGPRGDKSKVESIENETLKHLGYAIPHV